MIPPNFPFHPKLHTSQPWQEGPCLEPVLKIAEMFDINSDFRIHSSASNDELESMTNKTSYSQGCLGFLSHT